MNRIMHPDELRKHVKEFLRGRSAGALGTCMNGIPRTSPVQYFPGQDLEIYILSAGGEKFRAIEENPHVCLLVNTDYINYTRIKGVQIFGKATTSEEEPRILHEAREFCPDGFVLEYIKDMVKAIKIVPEEIVYLNSLDNGDRTKQILTREHMTVRERTYPFANQ